jgi:hypothetical protein
MKKLLLLIALLLSFLGSKAQESILFKIKFLPNNLYESTLNTNMNMEMNFFGDSASLKRIKDKGIKLPMMLSSVTNMNFSIKTGSLKSDKDYNIEICYKDINSKQTINGNEKEGQANPLKGETIFGNYTADGKIHVNSMSGGDLNDGVRHQLEEMLDNLINQIKFPTERMKIGDTFNQEIPFVLPVAGTNLKATIKITYKLTKIEDQLAYFDLDESMDLNLAIEKDSKIITVNGSGIGSGNLIYNVKKNYAPKRNATLTMNYKMLMGTITVTGKADITSTTETKLTTGNQ